MRKYSVMFATVLLVLGAATSTEAMNLSAPVGLRAAIKDTTSVTPVYWGWGWRRPYWGAAYVVPPVYVVRPVVVAPPVVVVPRVYAPVWYPRPRFYARRYFWGGPRFYGW